MIVEEPGPLDTAAIRNRLKNGSDGWSVHSLRHRLNDCLTEIDRLRAAVELRAVPAPPITTEEACPTRSQGAAVTAEQAWDEGERSGWQYGLKGGWEGKDHNPYRAAASEAEINYGYHAFRSDRRRGYETRCAWIGPFHKVCGENSAHPIHDQRGQTPVAGHEYVPDRTIGGRELCGWRASLNDDPCDEQRDHPIHQVAGHEFMAASYLHPCVTCGEAVDDHQRESAPVEQTPPPAEVERLTTEVRVWKLRTEIANRQRDDASEALVDIACELDRRAKLTVGLPGNKALRRAYFEASRMLRARAKWKNRDVSAAGSGRVAPPTEGSADD